MSVDRGKRARSITLHAVIDRIEDNDLAVLLLGEDEKAQVDFPVSLLPRGASDGDHLRITVALDEDARAAAEEKVRKLQDELLKRSNTEGRKNFKL